MNTIGIRELRRRTSELIRLVREDGLEIQITHRGRVVALLVPAPQARTDEEEARAWVELDRLAAEIGACWPQSISAAEAVSEARR